MCWLTQQSMEAEVTAAVGAGYGERHPDRLTRRNGYWERKLGHPGRQGSYRRFNKSAAGR